MLSKPFVDAAFQFRKVISGQTVQKTRDEILASTIERSLGEALGQLYVKQYVQEKAKKRMLDLVNNFQKALAANLKAVLDQNVSPEEIFRETKKQTDYPNFDYFKGLIEKN